MSEFKLDTMVNVESIGVDATSHFGPGGTGDEFCTYP